MVELTLGREKNMLRQIFSPSPTVLTLSLFSAYLSLLHIHFLPFSPIVPSFVLLLSVSFCISVSVLPYSWSTLLTLLALLIQDMLKHSFEGA